MYVFTLFVYLVLLMKALSRIPLAQPLWRSVPALTGPVDAAHPPSAADVAVDVSDLSGQSSKICLPVPVARVFFVDKVWTARDMRSRALAV